MPEEQICNIRIVESKSDGTTTVRRLRNGDSFYILSGEPVKIGDHYQNPHAIITSIYYEPRKWWQFWKKKKQLGFQVTWEAE